jgi:hypothetical protein
MLTAYLDESGQEKPGFVTVSGFIGKEDQWKQLANEWPKGFEGSQRKSLHIKTFKFRHESERRLLANLGPIPRACGLRRIAGSVDVRDYHDLVKGTVAEVHAQGYALAMWPLIQAIEDAVPTTESYKLVFEEQQALGFYRNKWLEFISFSLSHPPRGAKNVRKRPKLIGWETIVKGQSFLCEPADYLCYHLAHKAEDPKSVRTEWTAPIMEGDSIWKRHLARDKARWFFSDVPKIGRENPDTLANWKKELRLGNLDPWAEVLKSPEPEDETL